MPRILVTGATGFVGQALCNALSTRGYVVRAGARRPEDVVRLPGEYEVSHIGNIAERTDWRSALDGVETVIHLASRVHVMKESAADPLAEFRDVNVAGTLRLAEAAAAGACRFIFISTIKVNGESTPLNQRFTANDRPSPEDAYSVSKYEAEVGLRQLADRTGIQVVIIRPPLVYGPRVKGNFLRLLSWIERGIPLPLANVNNRRSLIGVRNLVDFIIRSVEHPAAAGETFLVSDGEDVSSPRLVRQLAAAMGRRSRLFPVPLSLTRSILKVMGKEDLWRRVFGSLRVNCHEARDLLGWRPPVSVAEGLEEVGRWYVDSKKH